MAASFPSTVPTTTNLRGDLADNCSTLLSADITAAVTTIPVDDANSFPTAGLGAIKKGSGVIEVFAYTGKTTNSFTGVTRNFNGKGAAAFSADDEVSLYWAADHHNRHVQETIAIAQNLSDRFGLGATVAAHTVGSAALPSITFQGDLDTGLYWVSANKMGFVVAATLMVTLDSGGIDLTNNSALGMSQGTLANPVLYNRTNTDTGIYWPSTTEMGFTIDATAIASIRNSNSTDKGLLVASGFIKITNTGTAIAPAFAFETDTNTGIYQNGADILAFTAGGANRFQVTTAYLQPLVKIANIDGTAALPSYTFDSDNDTGFYRVGVNSTGLALGGEVVQLHDRTATNFYASNSGTPALRWQIDQAGLNSNNGSRLYCGDGTLALPGISFASDTDTGLFRINANEIRIGCGGALIATFAGSSWALTNGSTTVLEYDSANVEIGIRTAFTPSADNTYKIGRTGRRFSEVWAATGTIQTSHSEFKNEIREIDDLRVPKGVRYRWKDREGRSDDRVFMGFLADDLPDDAFDRNEDGTINKFGVHTSSVLGELCAGWHNHERRIAELENELARLRAA